MPDPQIYQFLCVLDQAFDQRSWHGTNLMGSLRGLSADAAAWRPGEGRHNVWELVVHATYWKYRVRRLLTEESPRSFEATGSNWFERPNGALEETAWRADVALLKAWHGRLREAVSSFDAKRLDQLPGKSEYTFSDHIAGVAAHDLYHTGQIQLIKRLQES